MPSKRKSRKTTHTSPTARRLVEAELEIARLKHALARIRQNRDLTRLKNETHALKTAKHAASAGEIVKAMFPVLDDLLAAGNRARHRLVEHADKQNHLLAELNRETARNANLSREIADALHAIAEALRQLAPNAEVAAR